jgi:hypothetical protein
MCAAFLQTNFSPNLVRVTAASLNCSRHWHVPRPMSCCRYVCQSCSFACRCCACVVCQAHRRQRSCALACAGRRPMPTRLSPPMSMRLSSMSLLVKSTRFLTVLGQFEAAVGSRPTVAMVVGSIAPMRPPTGVRRRQVDVPTADDNTTIATTTAVANTTMTGTATPTSALVRRRRQNRRQQATWRHLACGTRS